MGNPQVTPIVEHRHAGGFLIWDPSDGIVTRDPAIIAMGSGVITAGTVLGKITVGSVGVAAPIGVNVGNGTFGAIAIGAPAVPGAYTVEFADATHYAVSDPEGVEIGHGQTGAAFNAGGLAFTITAGATAFAPGDGFTITPGAASNKWVPFDPTAGDGREVAAGILWSEYVDTTLADKVGAVVDNGPARVNANELVWGANVTTVPQQTAALAQLLALGIKHT